MCSFLNTMNKSLLERLLDFYHISYEDYLNLTKDVDLSNFASGHTFNDIDNCVSLVKKAIANKEKIVIYGDYDADGVMGTSILVKMFQYLDYPVSYYIPSRYIDGYGLNMKHAKEYVEAGFNLVITVDNGISAFEPIEYLKNNGVKVLVLDHHQVQEKVPNADGICHPTYSKFGEVASSGAFTAFIYSISLLGYPDKYLATLASISLISDMMPLLEYNRNLLRAVFKNYQKNEFLPLHLLSDGDKLDENVIGMKIAPRINSVGRLIEDTSINDIVKFFTVDNPEWVLNYYSYIIGVNDSRKELSKETSESLPIMDNPKAIVVSGDYLEGIIGLVANQLMNKYHVPVVVFTNQGEEFKGSARSPEGFDIVNAFNKLSDLLITFGGHALAGGCSIKKENFEAFKERFIDLVSKTPLEYVSHPSIDIAFNELSMENYELIKSFAPFGESFPAPQFKLKRIKVDTLTYSRDQKHILTSIGYSLRLVGFNFAKEEVSKYSYVNLVGSLRKSNYKNMTYLEFMIKEIEEA